MPSIMTALTFEGIRRAKVRVTTEIKSLYLTLRNLFEPESNWLIKQIKIRKYLSFYDLPSLFDT